MYLLEWWGRIHRWSVSTAYMRPERLDELECDIEVGVEVENAVCW